MIRRITALAAGAILTAGLATAATMAARATTPSCTNIATPIALPISCGGLYFPQLGASGIQPNTGDLALTVQSAQWNGHLVDARYDPTNSAQDFTVYERCTFTDGTRPVFPTEANPCGINGTPVLNPQSGLPEFTAEFTPGGAHLGGVINSLANLCISVELVRNGPRSSFRWRLVLRTCNTPGVLFSPGVPDPPSGHGITGTVTDPNPFQTWSPVGPVTQVASAPPGFVFANDALSGNFANRLFVLDVPGGSLVPGQWLLAYPENDQVNQIGRLVGCDGAVWQVTPGHYDCP